MSGFDDAFFSGLKSQADKAENRADGDAVIAAAILADLFPEQRAVVEDDYTRKAVLCPRRAGKSWTALSYAFHTALTKPGALVAIVTLTAGSAQRIYWSTLLKFGRRYGLDLDRVGGVNNTSLTVTLLNGSVLFLVGAATRSEIEKLRGNSYDLVVIDECKSFSAGVLEEMIEEVLDAATADSGGTIMMIGTPGNVLAGPFYEATFKGYTKAPPDGGEPYPVSRTFKASEPYWSSTEHLPEWSFHSWTLADNTKVVDKHGRSPWANALITKRRKRWSDDNPKWRREYLGEWATSDDVLVYAFASLLAQDGETDCRVVWRPQFGQGFNKWGLPADEEWRYILGLDFGFEDDTAIVVLAYSTTHDTLYQVYDFKAKHMTPSVVGAKLTAVQAEFDGKIEVMVSDSGPMKMVLEEINAQFGLGLVPAEKNQKYDHIELLNSDLYDGKFKVRRDSELVHEWLHLQWDLESQTREEAIRRGKLLEDRRCANHLADACLYAHHFSIHHFARERTKRVVEGTPEWYREKRNAEIEKITARRVRERTGLISIDDLRDEMRAEQEAADYEAFRDAIFN